MLPRVVHNLWLGIAILTLVSLTFMKVNWGETGRHKVVIIQAGLIKYFLCIHSSKHLTFNLHINEICIILSMLNSISKLRNRFSICSSTAKIW